MNKLINFFRNNVDWKELGISMVIFLCFFILITVGMVLSGIWTLFGMHMILFCVIGLFISFLINLFKQIK